MAEIENTEPFVRMYHAESGNFAEATPTAIEEHWAAKGWTRVTDEGQGGPPDSGQGKTQAPASAKSGDPIDNLSDADLETKVRSQGVDPTGKSRDELIAVLKGA